MTDLQPFDYSALDTPDRAWLRDKTREVLTHLEEAAHHILECGRCLSEIKAALGHGAFTQWVETEFPLTLRSAQYRMHAWRFLRKTKRHFVFPAEILNYLASPGIPPKAREHIVAVADAGKPIDMRVAKEIVSAYRPVPKRRTVAALEIVDPAGDNVPDSLATQLAALVQRGELRISVVASEDADSDRSNNNRHRSVFRGEVCGVGAKDLAMAEAEAPTLAELAEKMIRGEPIQVCRGPCGKAKPYSAFSIKRSSPTGRESACKACEAARVKRYNKRKSG